MNLSSAGAPAALALTPESDVEEADLRSWLEERGIKDGAVLPVPANERWRRVLRLPPVGSWGQDGTLRGEVVTEGQAKAVRIEFYVLAWESDGERRVVWYRTGEEGSEGFQSWAG